MEIKALKTVRFTQVVESSGHPEPVTLWTAPEDDPVFSKAVKEHRVLTVIQRSVGTKADYGLVGFFKEPLATYLVFPKKLDYPPETKVVGIKYEQLAESKPRGPVHKAEEKRPAAKTQEKLPEPAPAAAPTKDVPGPRRSPARPAPPPKPPVPKRHRFRADVELTLRQVVPIEVEAGSATEAARLVRERMAEIQPNLEGAQISRRVSKPRKLADQIKPAE